MTCIVGVVHGDRVLMGADAASVSGWTHRRSNPKLWQRDGWLLGYCGSPRVGQLVRYAFEPPHRDDDQELTAYLATAFMDKLRSVLRDGGALEVKDSVEHQEGSSWLLVGRESRLFYVASDFQFGEAAEGYEAIGSGTDYALGAFYSTRHLKDPRKRIQTALAASEHHSIGVRGPFTILEQQGADDA